MHKIPVLGILIVAMTVQPCLCHGQSPYKLEWKKEIPLTVSGGLSLIAGQHLRNRVSLFTPDQFERLDAGVLNDADRLAVAYDSRHADDASDYVLQVSQFMPLLLLADDRSRAYFGEISVMYGETMLLANGLTQLIKYSVRRSRPYVYNPDTPTQQLQSANARASFVSGHTSATAAATFFTARVFADCYPESSLKPIVWTAAAIAPAVTGYLRVRAGKHYPTDVIGGYVLGALIGYGVPMLHRADRDRERRIMLDAGPNALSLTARF